jgi:hypothetical protein
VTPALRAYLRSRIHAAALERVTSTRECKDCGLDRPHDDFRKDRRVCRRCEDEARVERRRLVA